MILDPLSMEECAWCNARISLMLIDALNRGCSFDRARTDDALHDSVNIIRWNVKCSLRSISRSIVSSWNYIHTCDYLCMFQFLWNDEVRRPNFKYWHTKFKLNTKLNFQCPEWKKLKLLLTVYFCKIFFSQFFTALHKPALWN